MNHIYNIVWSRTKHAWVVASEIAHHYGDGGRLDKRVSGSQDAIKCNVLHRPIWQLRLGALLVSLALNPAAQAADYYWDINGVTPGAGGSSPSGTWSTTNSNLSTDSTGSTAVAPHTTTTADRLFFSAGTDATGSYTITVDGKQSIGRLTFEEGAINLTGGTLDFGTGVHVIDGDSTPDSISSTIAGSGTLRFSGGTITLNGTAPNTFSGAMQVGGAGTSADAILILAAPGGNAVSGSVLQIGSGAQVTPRGTVILGADDQINDTATVSISAGHYTGSSFFRMNGFDETIGGIDLSKFGAGSNAVFENGAASDATVTLAGSGTYTTASGDRVNGRILRDGGTGKLNIVVSLTGAGNQTFSGITPTYTGTTTINSGTLRLWNTSLWASDITLNGGTLQMHQTLTAGVSAGGGAPDPRIHTRTISGAGGTLQKTGDGVVVLSGNNSYQGATLISEGTLRAGSATAFGNNSAVTLANVAGASMDLNNFNISLGSLAGGGTTGGNVTLGSGTLTMGGNNSGTTYGGVISGTGGLVKTGSGTTILTGTNTYTGNTIISAGTLEIGNGGATGSIVGDILNNANLTFNRSGTLAYAGRITGTGPVNLGGSAVYSFTGDSNYSGNTTINSSTLRMEGGGSITTTGTTSLVGPDPVLSVRGAGSEYITGALALGSSSTTNTVTLNIEDGGVMRTTNGSLTQVGANSAVDLATINISGAGSLLDLSGIIGVGTFSSGISSIVNVTSGGELRSQGGRFGTPFGAGAPKSLTVSGAGSRWTNTGTLTMNNGSLSVLAGGKVTANSLSTASIGGETITVSGAGSDLTLTGALTTGGDGTTTINLADGGRFAIGGAATLASVATSTTILNIGGGEAQPPTAAGVLDASLLMFGPGTGRINFNHTDAGYLFSTALSGGGSINQVAGVTNLSANSSGFTGVSTVSGGVLSVNGVLGGASSTINVLTGGTLGGTGTIGGDVSIASGGTLSPGAYGMTPGVLTINGNLLLSNGSGLDYDFGQANIVGGPLNDLLAVNGDLTLDGTLDIENSGGGSMAPGVYRAINYSGALNNQTLDIGTAPAGTDFFVQTSIANQVNLINRAGLTLNFWDGNGPKNNSTINGGDGSWQASSGNDNWTSDTGVANAPYANGAFAIFMDNPGDVTVDNSQGNVTASGMQFMADGYVLQGGTLTLVGAPSSTIRVGDGTAAGAGMTTTISSVLAGNSTLVKADLGTLILAGANTYSGGTTIEGGTLQIANDSNLGDTAGAVTLDGGTLRTTSDITTGRALNLESNGIIQTSPGTTLTIAGLVSGTGSLEKTGTGALVFNNVASHTGATTLSAGTLQAGAANVLSAGSAHTVLAGATLDLAGFNQTVGSLTNGGTINMSSTPGTRLTVAGDYVGNGGTILLNASLMDDASVTDRLIVNGNTSGTSTLSVTNIGGTGAPTVEGIKIVDIAGTSNGTFNLQGNYVMAGQQAVIGGAYAYTLHKNGISTPTDGDWYLRSALINPPAAAPTGPLYQPGAPLFEAYPQVLLSLNSIPTLHQRVGDRYWAESSSGGSGGSGSAGSNAGFVGSTGTIESITHQAFWGRIEGDHISNEADRSTTGTRWDADQIKMQGGIDGVFLENSAGRLFAGLNVRYARSSADVRSFNGDGDIDINGYSLGASLTWASTNGFYVDGQAQTTWYDSDITSDTLNRRVESNNNGFGYAIGVEAGQSISINETWSLTPQAQLTYSGVDIDGFTDPFGTRVSLNDGDSLVARLGILANYRTPWKNHGGRLMQTNLYGIANLYHEFENDTGVNVSGTRLSHTVDRTWGGVGVGGSLAFGHGKFSLYGEAMAKTSLENPGDSYGLSGKVGFNIYW